MSWDVFFDDFVHHNLFIKSLANAMGTGTFMGNCTVFLAVDKSTGILPEEKGDVYGFY